jgi:hypothetical protein
MDLRARVLFVALVLAGGLVYLVQALAWFGGTSLGSDYTYFLPKLLYGYYWFHENGPWILPWFAPVWCGGVPYFASPQVMYYSLPQLLTLLVNPQTSVMLTYLVYGFGGGISMYWLLRRGFGVGSWLALLGGLLLLFNEFYLARMLVGHLTYHMVPLIPLIALLAILAIDADKGRRLWLTLANALLIAAFVQGGAANFVIPAMLSVGAIILLHSIRRPENTLTLVLNIGLAGLVAMALSASKIVASWSFMRWFPRPELDLGLFDSLTESVFASFTMLFMNPWIALAERPGTHYLIQGHELRFGISLVALFLLLIGSIAVPSILRRWRFSQGLMAMAVLLIMSLPVVLSVRLPEWHDVLKSLPYLKDTSLALRWLAVDIPVLIVIATTLAGRVLNGRWALTSSVLGAMLLVVSHLAFDRPSDSYYSTVELNAAWQHVSDGGAVPGVSSVGERPSTRSLIGLDDALIRGETPLYCYEPIFGYRLEKYPRGPLQPGSVLQATEGVLNIKKAACYVFPEQNACAPGDHYRQEELEQARRFISHQPVSFVMSGLQQAANVLSLITLILLLVLVMLVPARYLMGRW